MPKASLALGMEAMLSMEDEYPSEAVDGLERRNCKSVKLAVGNARRLAIAKNGRSTLLEYLEVKVIKIEFLYL